jgi:hypothetical protein
VKGSTAGLIVIALALVAAPASAQRRGNQPRQSAAPPVSAMPLPAPPLSAPSRGNQPPPVAAPPMKTASEGYWDAVRATSGPIGFPQATRHDQFTRPSRPRAYGSGPVYGYAPYAAAAEPVYVPVYVPGPVVYVPAPAAEPPAAAPAENNVPAAPRRPEKFYVIPGCYAGNKPPQPNALPATCDIQKLRVNTW